jgi:EAL domain-containing protein (putative c-di-GMP-specific phosphodiesterase class I)
MKQADAIARSPDDFYSHKLATAYRVASVVLIVLGMTWMAWMTLAGQAPLIVTNLVYVVVGVVLWRSIDTPTFKVVAALTHVVLFCVIVNISLLYDVPSEAAPRVTHLYFLALAFLFYLTFRPTSPTITNVVLIIYLGAFTLFSGTNYTPDFATPLPDEVRVIGAWFHSVVAVLIMCACVYIMQSEFAARTRQTRQLTAALAEGQFELYLQPQVGVDNVVFGAEALIRWNHPKRGLLGPGEFLDTAEELGLMGTVGKWVLTDACRRLAEWRDDPRTAGLTLSVNVSASQFLEPGFVADLKRTLTLSRVNPARLELELTESVVVIHPDDVIAKMNELVDFGVKLSLDDFGTGYSALQYLKRMPFSKIKIDQSFVRDMLHDDRDEVIVKGIIQLGKELHLTVVAEGVETEHQKQLLTELGCRQFQGYLFGRPAPASAFVSSLPPSEHSAVA